MQQRDLIDRMYKDMDAEKEAREAAWERNRSIGYDPGNVRSAFKWMLTRGWDCGRDWERERAAEREGTLRRGAYALERDNRLLRYRLHEEHFWRAGQLGQEPPLTMDLCPACTAITAALEAADR